MLRLVFDGHLSSKTDWCSQERLAFSPYSDLKTSSTNFFAIKGHGSINRYWFINKIYKSCEEDAGWLIFYSPGRINGCSWEKPSDAKIIFSRATNGTTWATGMDVIHEYVIVKLINFCMYFLATAGDVGEADVLAVFVD